MSRLILTALFLLVSGISPVVNAQQKPLKPDFSGSWTLSSGDRGWWGTELKATQSDKTLTVIRTVQRGPLTYLYNLDGSPSHFVTSIGGQDVDQLSTAKWDGSRFVLTTKYRAQGFDQEAMQVWSIDAAGNLTIELTVAKNGQAEPESLSTRSPRPGRPLALVPLGGRVRPTTNRILRAAMVCGARLSNVESGRSFASLPGDSGKE